MSDEVLLKLNLWVAAPEFDDKAATWRETHLEALDMPAMEETISKCGAVQHATCCAG